MDLPGGLVVKTLLPLQRTWVRSLIRKLGSHMSHGVAKNNIKLFNKTFLLMSKQYGDYCIHKTLILAVRLSNDSIWAEPYLVKYRDFNHHNPYFHL